MDHGTLGSPSTEHGHGEWDALLENPSFRVRLRTMFAGLSAPPDSREYKLARLEFDRLAAPVLAVALPILIVVCLAMRQPARPATMHRFIAIAPEPPVATAKLEPLLKPTTEPDPVPWPPLATLAAAGWAPSTPAPQPPTPPSDKFPPILSAPSPVRIGLPPPTRRPENLVEAVQTGGGTPEGESAVERALRWLKVNQQPDGSWPKNKTAMTALAVLSFLSHGERPEHSAEFGAAVKAGIEFLMATQREDGRWPGNYEQPIATYALCEAYGMTRNPLVRDAARRGVDVILRGQHASGGWDYGMKAGDRDDTSVMGWVGQALKAAQVSGVMDDPRELDAACRRLVLGFLRNGGADGGFGYTGPGNGGLSAVGALCLQLHGAGQHEQVRRTHKLMDGWGVSWATPRVPGESPQYYFYYAMNAKFLLWGGSARWSEWSRPILTEYAAAQKVIPAEESGYRDAEGTPRGIGWWENADRRSDRPVMDTCLAALQLMVYYRYLPSLRASDLLAAEASRRDDHTDDITIEIRR